MYYALNFAREKKNNNGLVKFFPLIEALQSSLNACNINQVKTGRFDNHMISAVKKSSQYSKELSEQSEAVQCHWLARYPHES